MDRQKIAIIVAAVGFLVAALIVFRTNSGGESYGDNNANFPDGTWWICGDATCGHTFILTMKQVGQHHEKHYGEPIPCAKCKMPAVRANRCRHCTEITVQERGGQTCPKCGKSLD